jgi:hypothetical protein
MTLEDGRSEILFFLLSGKSKRHEKIRQSVPLAALSNFERALRRSPNKINMVREFLQFRWYELEVGNIITVDL